ncbi:MAG: dihydropteroate synthase [Actinomycetota bacterium]|nr:dihydropteroate synthase [Actinomycetota bacterium]
MRCAVMGILNVTPDSFSDGGRYLDVGRAIEHGRMLAAQGADVVDVGGESSRPGAEPVPEAEERRRVLPVIEALAPTVRVSVDTVKPEVAEAAIAAGASIVNDISASLWRVAAAGGAGWVAMHMRGSPRTMQQQARYGDVVREVHDHVLDRARQALDAGVTEVWVDPGIGFAKATAHNLALLRHLPELVASGVPVLVGTSRKSFLGAIAPAVGGGHAPVGERLPASVATATWAMVAGCAMVRVHDVAATVQAARLVAGPLVGQDHDHSSLPPGAVAAAGGGGASTGGQCATAGGAGVGTGGVR